MIKDSERSQKTAIDWTRKDLLVGSFGSPEQFRNNMERKYYFVPERFMPGEDDEDHDPAYIAVYRSAGSGEQGVKYWGKVTSAETLRRAELPVPVRRNNPDEPYRVFYVEEWLTLERPVEFREIAVTLPRLSYSGLLTRCEYTFELFCISSEDELNLLGRLEDAAKRAGSAEDTGEELLYRMGFRSVLRRGNTIVLKGFLRVYRTIPFEAFARRPSEVFRKIKNFCTGS